jgi:hypothetical protein
MWALCALAGWVCFFYISVSFAVSFGRISFYSVLPSNIRYRRRAPSIDEHPLVLLERGGGAPRY